MNAQISREWIISLKIILHLLLLTFCCSLPSCFECRGLIPEHNAVLQHHQQQHINSSSMKNLFFNNMKNQSKAPLSQNNDENENLNSGLHNLVENEYRQSDRRRIVTTEKLLLSTSAVVASNELKENMNLTKENHHIYLDASVRSTKAIRPNFRKLWRRRNARNDKMRYRRISQGDYEQNNNNYNNNGHKLINIRNYTNQSMAPVARSTTTSIINNFNVNNFNRNNNMKQHNSGMTSSNIIATIYNTSQNHNEQKNEKIDDKVYDEMPIVNYDNIRSRRESAGYIQHQHSRHQPILKFLPINRSTSNRQKRKKYCSARDPKTLAFEAPTVFEGKIKSMTSDRQANFSATFEILKVYKKPNDFNLPRQVRLQFTYKNSSECDIYREEFRHRGYVRDELEQGKIYYLFVKQISLGNFSILGQPVRKNNRTLNEVLKGVNKKYGKQASIDFITPDLTVREGKKVKIVCKMSGEPPPKVTWFKDGKSITRNRAKYEFVYLRRRSDLIIKTAHRSDSGIYECRAKNKLTHKRPPVSQSTKLNVNYYDAGSDRTTETFNYASDLIECPTEYLLLCEHGGKCRYIEALREPSCICTEGYSGKTCENKIPNITASAYNNLLECPQYYGSFYC